MLAHGWEELAQLGLADRAGAGSPSSGHEHPIRPSQNPEHRDQLLAGERRLLAEEETEGPRQPAEQDAQVDERHVARGGIGEQHVEGVAPVDQVSPVSGCAEPAPAVCGSLRVLDDGVGVDDDGISSEIGPPAEIDVVPEDRQLRIETAELIPDVATDQHPRTADGQDVPGRIVLALVVLALLQPGLPTAAAGHRQSDLEQLPLIPPAADLGPDDCDIWPADGVFEEAAQGVRRRRAVVMEQPDPFDLLVPARLRRCAGTRRLETSLNRGPEPCRRGQRNHRAAAEGPFEQARGCVPTAGVDRDQAVRRTLSGV